MHAGIYSPVVTSLYFKCPWVPWRWHQLCLHIHPFQSISIFNFSYSQADHCHSIEHWYFLLARIFIGRYGFGSSTFPARDIGLLVIVCLVIESCVSSCWSPSCLRLTLFAVGGASPSFSLFFVTAATALWASVLGVVSRAASMKSLALSFDGVS